MIITGRGKGRWCTRFLEVWKWRISRRVKILARCWLLRGRKIKVRFAELVRYQGFIGGTFEGMCGGRPLPESHRRVRGG